MFAILLPIAITKIKATNPQQVKEYELQLATKPKILKILKERESSLTENNFVIGFDEYFIWGKPSYSYVPSLLLLIIPIFCRLSVRLALKDPELLKFSIHWYTADFEIPYSLIIWTMLFPFW